MFPGIDGFHWTVGHIVFICLFFAVAATILTTVSSAAWRTARIFGSERWLTCAGKRISRNCRNPTADAAMNLQDV